MNKLLSLFSILVTATQLSRAEICNNPNVDSSLYVSQDGTLVNEVAFVSQFSVKCSNIRENIPLYADVKGKILPVLKSYDRASYQLSWTEDVKKSFKNTYSINVYDEEGYASVRRAIRNNEDYGSVKPLFVLENYYSGPYKGPWVNSELMAFSLCIAVWYFAFVARSKLLS